MKKWKMAMVAGCVMAAGLEAQQIGAASKTALERGPHETRWEHLTEALDEEGRSVVVTNSFVELGTGLNRWDEQTGAWVPASAEIEIVNGRGIARGSQHKVIFAGNANDPNGTIELFSPEGDHFILQTIGLAYTERGTGRSVFIAEVQDSEGIVVGSSAVVYPNAFDGVRADIRCETSLSGFQSDVILREKIPAPEEYGLDSALTQLEVWHQVFRQPKVERTARKVKRRDGREDWDGEVQAGSLKFAAGNAFALGREEAKSEVQVTKEWTDLEGMSFLIEALPVEEAKGELEALPEPLEARGIPKRELEKALAGRGAAGRAKPISMADLAFIPRPKPTVQFAGLSRGTMAEQPGYLIDYTTINTSLTDYVFKGDTTYYVQGVVQLLGAGNVLEGGAVIKFAPYSSGMPRLEVRGTLTCKTSPHNPAIFTAKDDDTVGEPIAGSTGNPTGYYGYYNLRFLDSGIVELHDIRSKHAHNALGISRAGTHTVWNYQAVKCDKGLHTTTGTVNLHNALIVEMHYAIQADNAGAVVNAEHLTVDNSQILLLHNNLGVMRLTNSLTVNITDPIGQVTGHHWVNTTGGSVFQTVGMGGRYLADASVHRNAGTTTLTPKMSAILKESTTHPPVVLTANITRDTILKPVVPRDADLPDLGYHYPPIDYALSGLHLTNSTLTLQGGVAVAKYGVTGFYLKTSGKFRSLGSPTRMNTMVSYQAVQEKTGLWGAATTFMPWFHGVANFESKEFRHTEINFLAGPLDRRSIWYQPSHNGTLYLRDCVVRNAHQSLKAYSTLYPIPFDFLNSVAERCTFSLDQQYASSYYALTANVFNSLFRNSQITVNLGYGTAPVKLHDSLYENCVLTVSQGSMNPLSSHNAYKSCNQAWPGGTSAQILDPATPLAWVPGPLGPYYYPTTGSSGTLGHLSSIPGSRSVEAAGLAHHTIHANQAKDVDSVQIGFHYVALDTATGKPKDTDGDGVPDFLEDPNGNNTTDPGETNFLLPQSQLMGNSGLVVFTPLENP